MVNIFCCILVCGQKIFSKGARNGTKGKISDHSGELFKRKCQVIVERASKFWKIWEVLQENVALIRIALEKYFIKPLGEKGYLPQGFVPWRKIYIVSHFCLERIWMISRREVRLFSENTLVSHKNIFSHFEAEQDQEI